MDDSEADSQNRLANDIVVLKIQPTVCSPELQNTSFEGFARCCYCTGTNLITFLNPSVEMYLHYEQ